MPKQTKKGAGRYMVQLDPEVARTYQKLSDKSQVPVVRLVNTALLGFAPLMAKAIADRVGDPFLTVKLDPSLNPLFKKAK